MPLIKPGTRLRSAVCATEVMAVAAPKESVELSCGGAPMCELSAEPTAGASLDDAHRHLLERFRPVEGVTQVIVGTGGKSIRPVAPKRLAHHEERFGFLLNALEIGAPPHGGFAYGYDRWAMLLAGLDSLRDVIAFPKTQRAQDLLMDAPGPVGADQREELALRLVRPPNPDDD